MASTGCSSEGMEAYALRVIGDSMSPEFEDGNIIIVDPAFPLLDGVFAVVVNNEEVIFGQYFVGGPGHDQPDCRIEYLKPGMEPVILSPGFQKKGVITQRNGRRRKDIKQYEYPAKVTLDSATS
ncbi:MAG: S24 family peptidase [Ectothiorhodospiraceae bacterium]|nr:S24 family peptidase [Ectothiorhodospiraceae bacterium]